MEQMIKGAKRLGSAISGAYAEYFGDSMLLSAVLSGLVGFVLASFRPEKGIAPFGIGCAAGVWYAGVSPYFACAGAFLGHAVSGSPGFAAAAAGLALAAAVAERFYTLSRIVRLLIAFGAECAALTIASAAEGFPLVFGLGSACVSVLAAMIIGHGVRACQQLASERGLGDAGLMALAASAGMITLSLGSFNVCGLSPAIVFCGVCSLILAMRCGAASVAFAVAAAAGRVLVTGGDMYFIAVLSAGALVASSLRSMGKTAVMLGFGVTNLIFGSVLSGASLFSTAENALCCVIFMLLPKRLYSPPSPAGKRSPRSRHDAAYSSMQYRISGLAEVLSGLSTVYGGESGRMLGCISDTLRRALVNNESKRAAFTVETGCAACSKADSSRSGDSASVKRIEGGMLLCLSDGMGSGEAAGRQSRETVGLFCDLLTVGFSMQEAGGFINRLMAMRAGDDMYSTLDAVLVDLADGTAAVEKLGAAPSFVLRGGRLYTLYAENLPVGVKADAGAQVKKVALKRGDLLIMMTDGVYDALGSSLMAELTDRAGAGCDPQAAADSIFEAASKDGAADDMTVLTARIA